MNTTAYAQPAPLHARAATTSSGRPRLLRLAALELRKMTNTRSGFWLMLTVAALAVGLAALQVLVGKPAEQTATQVFEIALLPVGSLLPVVGILAVTAEWSQRTALTTFTLVPQRGRIAAAKVLAGVLLAIAATAACLVVATAASSVGSGFDLTVAAVLGGLLFAAISILIGVAFGMVFQAPALAIVLYFVVPMVWEVVIGLVHSLQGVGDWLNQSATMMPLLENHMAGSDWARLATTVAFWLALPLTVGVIRLLRREVK
jgi:hypothetical protein